jgi:hypothetical protein
MLGDTGFAPTGTRPTARVRGWSYEEGRANGEVAPTLGAGGDGEARLSIPKRQRFSPESFSDIMSRIHIFTLEENLALMNSGQEVLSDSGLEGVAGDGWGDDSILKEVAE